MATDGDVYNDEPPLAMTGTLEAEGQAANPADQN